ncbi:MAG: LON peptidase substrate-binding domain-containing protein [Verrucomicrobia bacterium]|nr:LON peptidase substrate-binding domain-containing protein [Verrucomicrobiota bacterium]
MHRLTTFNLEQPIPVFPLNGCVLLPYAMVPLNIFEPRYVKMVEDALDAAGLIALGAFDREVSEDEYYHGTPALKPLVGLGYIEEYKALDKGRYAMTVRGLIRARIDREIESPNYRRVLLTPIVNVLDTPERMERLREQIVALLEKSKLLRGDTREEVLGRAREEPVERLVDEIGGVLIKDPATLEILLAETHVAKRAVRVIDHLATAISVGLG